MDAKQLTELIAEEAEGYIAPNASLASIKIIEYPPWKRFYPHEGKIQEGSDEWSVSRDVTFDVKARLDLAASTGSNPMEALEGICKRILKERCPKDYEDRLRGVGNTLMSIIQTGGAPSVETISKVVVSYVLGKWAEAPGIKEGWADKWERWAKNAAGTDDYSILVLGIGHQPGDPEDPEAEGSGYACLLSYHEVTYPFNPDNMVLDEIVKEALGVLGCIKPDTD